VLCGFTNLQKKKKKFLLFSIEKYNVVPNEEESKGVFDFMWIDDK